MEQLLRPYGVVIDGVLELGLEILVVDGVIRDVRPHTGIPDPFVISPAFVNAHSHLEYRGLQGAMRATEYWPWIREIILAKQSQTADGVRRDCILAARENRETGVALIAEHSDRPFAGEALIAAGLKGVIFQEVITRFEKEGPRARVAKALENRVRQSLVSGGPAYLSPHALQTVDEESLRAFGAGKFPFSIHVAETDLENQLTLTGAGEIGDTFRVLGVPFSPTGKRIVPTLDDFGLLREGAQFVHCCAIDQSEINLMAVRGVNVAHCPRSNRHLGCPAAPVREMLDAGIRIGLGLDSAASSGPIDIFDEMRCALEVSDLRGEALTPEEVWGMATTMGADSLRPLIPGLQNWRIEPGSSVPLIRLNVEGCYDTGELIERGSPKSVEP